MGALPWRSAQVPAGCTVDRGRSRGGPRRAQPPPGCGEVVRGRTNERPTSSARSSAPHVCDRTTVDPGGTRDARRRRASPAHCVALSPPAAIQPLSLSCPARGRPRSLATFYYNCRHRDHNGLLAVCFSCPGGQPRCRFLSEVRFTFACCRLRIRGIARRSSRGSTRWFCIGCSSVIRALSRGKRRISGRMDGVVMLGPGHSGGRRGRTARGVERKDERRRMSERENRTVRRRKIAATPWPAPRTIRRPPTADRTTLARSWLTHELMTHSLARSHHPAPGL